MSKSNIGSAIRGVATKAAALKMAHTIDSSVSASEFKPGDTAYWSRYSRGRGNAQ